MLIDSHAHLNMSQFDKDREAVLARASSAGIGEILNLGYDPVSIGKAVDLADRYGQVYAAVGIHPHEATEWNGDLEETIKTLLLRRKVLAVGEIGLDYYRDLSPRDLQREVFRKQIGIAQYFGKPIVVHCREAFEDTMKILAEEGAGEVGGIFHAFPGGVGEAEEIMKLGFLVGIGGPVTFKNSKLPEAVERLPSSGFVLETDCPYLTPVPYRGKRNEPAYVSIVAEKVSEIRGVSVEDVERAAEVSYRRVLHGDDDLPSSVVYSIKDNLYINVTNFCTNDCVFCPRSGRDRTLYGYNLDLVAEPDAETMISEASRAFDERSFKEIVFCGYGEPTSRLDAILSAAAGLKGRGATVRLNTNGHGNMINRRNIVPELERSFDRVSVSLNAWDKDSYARFCRPDNGERTFESVVDFIRAASQSRVECVVTAVDYPGVDIDKCAALVDRIPGALFRKRTFHLAPPAIRSRARRDLSRRLKKG